jgi:hypothetical protein
MPCSSKNFFLASHHLIVQALANLYLRSIEQGSSSEVGLVPDAMCGRASGIIELDLTQSNAAYLPCAPTLSHRVSSVDVGAMPEETIKYASRKGRFAKHTDDTDADADAAYVLDFGKLRRRAIF